MWSALPEGADQYVIACMGGPSLMDTMMLRQVSHRFLYLAEKAAEQHLESEDVSVRLEALKAYISVAESGKIGAIQGILGRAEDQDAALRQHALGAVSYLLTKADPDAPAAVAVGIKLLCDENSAVRQAVRLLLCALAEKSNPKVLAALVAVIRSDPKECLRQEAVETLAATALRGDVNAVEALRGSLDDVSLAVRCEAVAALGDISDFCDQAITSALCTHYADPSPSIRCALAHASAILAPWGDSATIDALLSILGDSHPDVRVRGIAALGALAEPSDEVVLAAISACEQDTNESVCDAAKTALKMLAAPDVNEPAIVLPQPCNIEGVKSKKATLFSVESLGRQGALLSAKASAERLCLSRASRVLLNVDDGLDRSRLLERLASELPATLEVYRHPRARFISVTERSVRQLYHEHSGRTGLEVLTALAPKQSLEDAEDHLAQFGLADKKSSLVRSLHRSDLARLSLAAAFWPVAPHILLLDDPGRWGLGDSGLACLSSALQIFSGGVLLASGDSELAKTFADRWTIGDGFVQREILGAH
eukprot:TRINITY_DN89906_c0_g1_i1.p1 TRINITY_DN89906_c0_g1~~TRINITY_DN89906_c0_g1_i1.p1  ORF type:complete len:540 (-),score=86.28 TRINITY_DN89906_c0_g1_i1:71-1690(-)